MKKKFIITTLLALWSCSIFTGIEYDGPNIRMKRKISTEKIAVIGFVTDGNTLPRGIDKFAARRLNDILFIKGQYNVLDYSKTQSGIDKCEVNSLDNLSQEKLGKLKGELDVEYFIIGSIIQHSSRVFEEPGTEQKITLGIRIIDASNYEVAGIISASCVFSKGIKERIEELLNKSIDTLIQVR